MQTKTSLIERIISIRLEYFVYSLAFFIPLFISGPQWLTGTVVNALLFVSIQRLSFKKVIPMTVLPSLGAVLNGILFGSATVFLYYFLPFIWLGNLILILFFKKFEKNYLFAVLSSSVVKSLLLFGIANLYFSQQIVPKIFLTAMGSFQLVTAVLGGGLSYLIIETPHELTLGESLTSYCPGVETRPKRKSRFPSLDLHSKVISRRRVKKINDRG